MSAAPVAAWMAFGLVVGLLIAAAAAVGETLLRGAGRPGRWVWAGALGLTVTLVALAPQRTGGPVVSPIASAAAVPAARAAAAGTLRWTDRAINAVASASDWAGRPLRWALRATADVVPAGFNRWLLAGWGTLSVMLLALFSLVYARFDRARSRWPLADLQGTQVRVAPDAGPAVVGLARPEIIVPGWLLERTTDEQRLVLAHEREHVVARDPLLLAAACAAAVVIPWHPAAWWMLSRLRLAVELDCDQRVLRGGVAAQSYGTLLIDLAGRCSGLRIGAPALADESTHLQQRLLAMTSRNSRLSITRSAFAAAFATVALLAACEARLPTATEVDDMTASSAATLGRKSLLLSKDSLDAQWQVDGVIVSAAEARGIAPDKIASIEVIKGPSAPNGKGMIAITTRKPGDDVPQPTLGTRFRVKMPMEPGATPADPSGLPQRKLDNFTGVILLDGVRVSEAAMQAVAPDQIVSVEIIKGEPAAALYAAPEAKNGVIRITTKKSRAK